MWHVTRRCVLLVVVLVAVVGGASPRGAWAQSGVEREAVTITFADGQTTKGELTYPAGAAGRLPTLVLIGNPDTDMNFTLPADVPGGPVAIYSDLAEALSARGLAVLRFNQRYITGPGEGDFEKVFAVTTADLAADAEGALAAARAHPRVDPSRLFLWGWSFSSPAAAAVAARDTGLAGLVLLGAVSSTSRDYFIGDYSEVVLPYLRRFAPDGRVTADTLEQAFSGDGGFFASGVSRDFADPDEGDEVKVNPFFDANGDGVLEIDAEIAPKLGDWVDADPFGIVANLRALPSVGEQAPNIRIPSLILQGERDAATRLSGAQGLDAAFAGNPRYTFKLYGGVGHALQPTPDLIGDRFGALPSQAKDDVAAWVLAQPATAMPASLPRTGSQEVWPFAQFLLLTAALMLITGLGMSRRGAATG